MSRLYNTFKLSEPFTNFLRLPILPEKHPVELSDRVIEFVLRPCPIRDCLWAAWDHWSVRGTQVDFGFHGGKLSPKKTSKNNPGGRFF